MLAEEDTLTEEEMDFRLKGKTSAGRRWNEHYDVLIADYKASVKENAGDAGDIAAEVRKTLGGIRRLAQAAMAGKGK